MTRAELEKVLKETGLPVAYRAFTAYQNRPLPSPPYLVYLRAYARHRAADDRATVRTSSYQIELYTRKKDEKSEKLVEDVLNRHGFYYDMDEIYLESERVYQVVYNIKIIGG